MPSFSPTDVDHLRNNIDFASIAQFFHTFQSAFRPWPVSYNPATFLSRTNRNLNRNRKQTDDDYVFATEVSNLPNLAGSPLPLFLYTSSFCINIPKKKEEQERKRVAESFRHALTLYRTWNVCFWTATNATVSRSSWCACFEF